MNKKILVAFTLFAIILASFALVRSVSLDEKKLEMKKGKNIFVYDSEERIYVDSLIKLNPNIEVVSYNSEEGSVGYVNIFGGIGKNFIIVPGEYEIIVSDDTTLRLSGE